MPKGTESSNLSASAEKKISYLENYIFSTTVLKNEKPKNKAPKGYKFIKSEHGVEEYRLVSNGLRVLIKEVHFAPIATLNVTYHVGSRNEALGHTGATHFLEHLLFKGTKKYPGKRFTHILEGSGARVNATTWFDRTNYYETMPLEILPKAIDIEADRMRNAAFTEYDKKWK